MGNAYIFSKGVRKQGLERLPVSVLKSPGTWIDLTAPSAAELEKIRKVFGIHPLIIEDMSKSLTRPKLESFPNYDFIVLYGVSSEKKIKVRELDFIVGKNFVISSHLEGVASFEELKKTPEIVSGLMKKGTDFLLHRLIDMEIDNYAPAISSIDGELEELEKKAVKNPKPELLTRLFDLKRQLLGVRKVSNPERDVLSQLAKRDYRFISQEAEAYFRDVYDHIIRLNDQIENYREIISSILEVHLSVTSNRLNEIMKVLTIITTVLMPVTAVAGIYGMNFRNMPELGWHYGYYMALGLMLLISLAMVFYLKKRNWI